MIHHVLLASVLALPLSPDEESWLSRLELPTRFTHSIRSSPIAFERAIELKRFELDFPEGDPEEIVQNAKERIEAGEAPARLLHQGAYALLLMEENEAGWKWLMAALDAYTAVIDEEPDHFEHRMYFAHALHSAGRMTGGDEFFEAMVEAYEAAGDIEPGDFRPATHCSWAFLYRWLRAKGEGEVEWLDVSLEFAERAVEADSTEADGHWMLFEVGCVRLNVTYEGGRRGKGVELVAVADVLLEGCEDLDDSERSDMVRFAGHFFRASFSLMTLSADPDEEERSDLLAAMSADIELVMAEERFVELSGSLGEVVAATFWAFRCNTMEADDESWEADLERVCEMGLVREIATGMVAVFAQRRGHDTIAAKAASLLEEEIESDQGRAALVAYCYEASDFEAALEALDGYEETAPETEIQRAVILLRMGQRDEARELLEELAEEHDESGHLYHALGVARALDGELEGAIEALDTAADLLEDDEDVLETLAELEELLEDEAA